MRKKFFGLSLSALLLALSFPADAQQSKKIPRVGFLSGSGDSKKPGAVVEAFRQGLRDLDYIEGKNILIEYRYIEGQRERIPSLVIELVQLKIDVDVYNNLNPASPVQLVLNFTEDVAERRAA